MEGRLEPPRRLIALQKKTRAWRGRPGQGVRDVRAGSFFVSPGGLVIPAPQEQRESKYQLNPKNENCVT
jgi:hypothetical protein